MSQDRTAPSSFLSHAVRAQLVPFFAGLGLRIVDVPALGDCAVHAVMPTVAAWLGRDTTLAETRALLVAAWRHAPAFQAELARELAVERAARGWPADATTDALLAVFARASQYLPPGLVAEATHFITGAAVQVYMVGTGAEGESKPALLCDIAGLRPGAAPCRLLYIEQKRHMCRLEPAYDEGSGMAE